MLSRPFAAALLVSTCVAAAGGSYVALRQNVTEAAPGIATVPVSGTTGADDKPTVPAEASPVEVVPSRPELEAPVPARPADPRPVPSPTRIRRAPVTRAAAVEIGAAALPGPIATQEAAPVATSPAVVERSAPEPPPVSEPEVTAPEALLTEIVVPSSAVIGLEIETTITSEQARVEDRVDARVTRDVYADGRLAIPAGSRVIGAVTVVERGGKIKDRARLGVRFHTLVLAGGRQVPLRTEAIYREGDSPGAESSRKIGGAAIGGAVLGAILGGGKGAVAGASVGAAGGTAAVMAGGRNAATLAGGSVVTVRLSAPVSLQVERDQQ
jgi:type IV secretory pathway VirB10-like protein